MLSLSSTSALLKLPLLKDGDAIYQSEAFEQRTIPNANTLPFSIYQIKLVAQLMNQINRRLRQTNQTTEMLIETQTTYIGENCSNTRDCSETKSSI